MGTWLHPKKEVDFVSMRKVATTMSVFLVLASIALFFFRGPTWGIDFTGGTEIHLKFKDSTEIDTLRSALKEEGLGSDSVQQIGSPNDNEFVVRIQDPEFGTKELEAEVTNALIAKFGEGATKSGATLKGIFEKAIGKKGKKEE